ncbi:MAG: DUF3253 domain-containing protein [Kordiimonadaceae bacterium]|nr:DUF3253 domain-containing protein [Kordiimonadaceae bacterium]
MAADNEIRDEILKQTAEKASVAPRDIAQALTVGEEDWRKYLPRIRQQATALHGEGQLVFIRKRKIVPPEGLKGVFRLAQPTGAACPDLGITEAPNGNGG